MTAKSKVRELAKKPIVGDRCGKAEGPQVLRVKSLFLSSWKQKEHIFGSSTCGKSPWEELPCTCVWPLTSSSHPSLSAGPPLSPWTDLEIRSFLQKWEVVEQEIGHPGKKIKRKARLVCQRLYEMGLKKTRESCLGLMWTLKHLHETLINERPKTEPLFSPYAEALYRILGPKCQGGYVPGESLLHRHFRDCKQWHQLAWPSWG